MPCRYSVRQHDRESDIAFIHQFFKPEMNADELTFQTQYGRIFVLFTFAPLLKIDPNEVRDRLLRVAMYHTD